MNGPEGLKWGWGRLAGWDKQCSRVLHWQLVGGQRKFKELLQRLVGVEALVLLEGWIGGAWGVEEFGAEAGRGVSTGGGSLR